MRCCFFFVFFCYGCSTVVLICFTCPAITVGTVILRALDRARGRVLGLLGSGSPKSQHGGEGEGGVDPLLLSGEKVRPQSVLANLKTMGRSRPCVPFTCRRVCDQRAACQMRIMPSHTRSMVLARPCARPLESARPSAPVHHRPQSPGLSLTGRRMATADF